MAHVAKARLVVAIRNRTLIEERAMNMQPFMHTLRAILFVLLTSVAVQSPVRAQEASREEVTAEQGPSAEVINIQTASVEELQRLPGIGPAKAEAIVAQRTRAPFRRIEDILRVRGIGRATFRRLRPYLTISGPTTLTRDLPMRRAESE